MANKHLKKKRLEKYIEIFSRPCQHDSLRKIIRNPGKNVGDQDPHALLMGMRTNPATIENSMIVSRKPKIDLPCDPAIDVHLPEGVQVNRSQRHLYIKI